MVAEFAGARVTLVLGGTRSGKSEAAEGIAARLADHVTYIATADLDPVDVDHAARIDQHRRRRPRSWSTIECRGPLDLPNILRSTTGVVLVDSLGSWVSSHPDLTVDPVRLIDALEGRSDPTVVVSEEVGLSVHPATEVGRRYVDVLGDLNRRVAAAADRVLLVVAGQWIVLSDTEGQEGDPLC